MPSASTPLIPRERPAFYLPDFCRAQSVLAVILIAELVALLLTLARHGISEGFWPALARSSLFLLWAALGTAALFCALRGPLSRLDVMKGSILALMLMLIVTALVTEGAWWLSDYSNRMLGLADRPLTTEHLQFLLRNLAVCAIAGGLALRYFYVTHQWRSNVEAEAQSRVRALQARIRPHFLFNSMNTIASLTRTNPRVAEQAIADLSDLFRASLREHRETIPLASEIEIARAYERVERLRLGDRLRVDWQLDALPMDAQVPALILQPLLENAVYHGVEPATGASDVLVRIERRGNRVLARIENPYCEHEMAHRTGNRMALDNIRERLRLFFDAEARLESAVEAGRYWVEIEMPYRSGGRGRP